MPLFMQIGYPRVRFGSSTNFKKHMCNRGDDVDSGDIIGAAAKQKVRMRTTCIKIIHCIYINGKGSRKFSSLFPKNKDAYKGNKYKHALIACTIIH